MLNRVLVATDGSETAQRAEALGGEIARRFGATLLLAHAAVEEPSEAELGAIGQVMQDMGPQPFAPLHPDNVVQQVGSASWAHEVRTRRDAMRELGRQMLRHAEERARNTGVEDVERHLLHGDAADAIVELAQQQNAELIVIGTRGIGGLRGRLMGSVSGEVMKHTRKNTLVVRE